MLFNINVSSAGSGPGGNFNINVQVEAPDLLQALEGAKDPMLKIAQAQAEAIFSSLPTTNPGKPKKA